MFSFGKREDDGVMDAPSECLVDVFAEVGGEDDDASYSSIF